MSLNDPLMPAFATREPPSYRPLGGLGIAAVATVVLACLVRVIDLSFSWYAYRAVDDYLNGVGDATYGEVMDMLTLGESLAPFLVIAWLAAPVMFVVWLWRARLNAELINPHEQHLARGWAIGGWICPIVNFWFPFRIVHDIWRVSRPAGLTSPGRPVHWWWTAWVLYLIARIWLRAELRSEESLEALRGIAVAHTVAAVLEGVAGVLVIVVIRQITTWQKAPASASV
jgi:Domain of unknown function (DUF4328)